MTIEHTFGHMDEVAGEIPATGIKKKDLGNLTRRDFLKLASVGTGAFFVGNTLLGEYVSRLDPEIEKIEGALSEYKIGWQARPWVWTNLAVASERIEGAVLKPGEEVSMNNLLGFADMQNLSRENTDPRRGYVAAQMSDPSKLDGWGYGLCLGSTAVFRACLNSPLLITERGTHYDIYPDYFKDMPIGTDAAVFSPDPGDKLPETDLKLKNPTDSPLTLHLGVYNSFGRRLQPPNGEISMVWYKATYLDQLVRVIRAKVEGTTGLDFPRQYVPESAFGNQRIIVRAAVTGDFRDYQVNLGPVKHGDSTYNQATGTTDYVFNRTVAIGGEKPTVYTEKFVSNYGQSPLNQAALGGE